MPAKHTHDVTMRVRVGDNEVEVTGPVAFVEKKIAEFLARQEGARPATSPSAPTRGSGSREVSPARKKATSVAQFFRNVGARTDIDRVLAAGYFMETYKEQESFTAAEVRETIRAAKISPPGNPSDAIAKNIKKGYMMGAGDKDGKKAFVLTTDGEDAIRDALND